MKYRNQENVEVTAHEFNSNSPHEDAIVAWVSKKTGKPLKSAPKKPNIAERLHIINGQVARDGDYVIVEPNMTSHVITADEFASQYVVA